MLRHENSINTVARVGLVDGNPVPHASHSRVRVIPHPQSSKGEANRGEAGRASKHHQHNGPDRQEWNRDNGHLLTSVAEVVVSSTDKVISSYGSYECNEFISQSDC